MPIRFRCVYCNQLLGISRRKAGTIVRCTTCEGQLIVPDPGAVETEMASSKERAAAQPPATEAAGAGGFFEQSDFDDLLQPYQKTGQSSAAVANPPKPAASPAPPRERASPTAPAPTQSATAALVLSRKYLKVVSVELVIGLEMAFDGGLVQGLSLH